MTTPTPLDLALDSIEQIETLAAAQQACPSLTPQQGLRLIELLARLTTLAVARTDTSQVGVNNQ